MRGKKKCAVSIIGGADGPTSIFIAGKSQEKSLKNKFRNYRRQYKRKKRMKKIVAGEHSLEEVVLYAMDKYHMAEVDKNQRKYVEQRDCLKEGLVLKYRPELLGDMQEIPKPDFQDEDSVREFLNQTKLRSEMIAGISDDEMPVDFHLYQTELADGCLEMAIEYRWKLFGVSYSGSKKMVKQLKKIARDLYIYYGVTGDDIKEKSERYLSLLEWI